MMISENPSLLAVIVNAVLMGVLLFFLTVGAGFLVGVFVMSYRLLVH